MASVAQTVPAIVAHVIDMLTRFEKGGDITDTDARNYNAAIGYVMKTLYQAGRYSNLVRESGF